MAEHEHFSFIGQTAYQDLIRLLGDATVTSIQGAPTLRTRGPRGYWYDRYRIGDKIVEAYIGEDTPDLRKRLEYYRTIKKQSADRQKQQAHLIRLLSTEGYRRPDIAYGRLMAAFANAGLFRLGGTLIGTHAFRLYETELSVRFALDRLAATNDIASFERLSVALGDTTNPDITEVLRKFEFESVPGLDKNTVWRWRQARQGGLVEFLTPSFSAEEDIRELPTIGVHARALHFLNYLIADPIPAAVLYRYGTLVQIPRPERYAIHKLIVADRRRGGPDSAKSAKDRAQAAFLIDILATDRPGDLAQAYTDALSRGKKWQIRLSASLKRLPKAAGILNELIVG